MLNLTSKLGKLNCRYWAKLEENVVTVGREGVLNASLEAQLDSSW